MAVKRGLDLGISAISLFALAIPFAAIALAIKLDGRGPVFFRQERVGKGGRAFRVWKFRTMVAGAINHGLGLNVAHNDSRITRVGRVLRNLGLDELPQLLNVLVGEMSLAGRCRQETMNAEKRVFDLVLTTPALVLLSPVMAVVAVAVYVGMGRPVLFRHQRLGMQGKVFVVYKFRTMTDARDLQGRLLPDSERITHLGSLLRKSSVDELPQLLNVIQGTMSLVGPRPLLVRYAPYFTKEERQRFSVRPGITGLALILGRNDLPWDARMSADVQYVEKWSLWLDFRILATTLWHVARRKGLRLDPSQSMPDFDEERKARAKGDSRGS
jgi:lipopolysaccharide/colanic/teichoic acid biosynthesis glycosyltransferase